MGNRRPRDAGSGRLSAAVFRQVRWIVWVSLGVYAQAQSQDFWSFLPHGRVVTRCSASSAAHEEAGARLDALDRSIQRLESTDPAATLVGDLHGLLRTECFWLAAETDRVPRPDSAISLKEWWTAGGGRAWLESYLELPLPGADGLVTHIVVPPDARRTFSLDAHQDHPLRSLLCRAADSSCGAETRGWKLRAEAHFESHRALGRDRPASVDHRPATDAGLASQQCATLAAGGDQADRYQAWRACIEARRRRNIALPLGEFKGPGAGWLVISGRRGHYTFCDSRRAYDLATGAAFIDESCSGLALKPNGRVDLKATNQARTERIRAGAVRADNLREAVWMMLLRGETEEVQLQADFYPLPEGLVPELRIAGRPSNESAGRTVSIDTSQTALTWLWLPPGGSTFAGELTWPGSYDAAEDHAVRLLQIAEESFVAGCPPKRVPAQSAFSARRPARLNDLPEEAIERLDREIRFASAKWRASGICESRPR